MTTMTTRPPAVAGLFYHADPEELADVVDRLVDAVEVPDDDELAAAYIVPHAGYRYSGPVAAHVYARLRRHAAAVQRVVIIGPAHRVPLIGIAVTGADRWSTPLGEVRIETEAVPAVVAAGAVIDDVPHATEHSLEVQVPFVQRVLGHPVPFLPVCVGRSAPEQVAAVIEAAGAGRPGTVVLCSTDLSHYLTDPEARAQDARTAEAIVELSHERIGPKDACGIFALRGILQWVRSDPSGVAERLTLATSAATGGDRDRVVGYPAFALRRQASGGSAAGGEGTAEPDQTV